MSGSCEEFDRLRSDGEGERERHWREHLAGCAACREQSRADVLLRVALDTHAPELGAGFEQRLRARLEQRAAPRSRAASHPGRLGSSDLWTLGAYATAAAVASAVILSRLPWQSLTLSPALGITLGALALLSPLVLLDRLGIVRPPG